MNKAQLAEVNNTPKLLGLTEKRNDYKWQIHALSYNKIPDTKSKTSLYNKYTVTKVKFNAKKALLKDKYLKAVHDEYFETVDTKEINNQLNGIIPRKAFILPAIKYKLMDRATVVQLFFKLVDNLEAFKVF